MNLKRLRDPLVAALGALLIAGVSVAMANESTPSNTTTSVEERAEAPETETDGPGGHEDLTDDVDHQFEGEE